MGETIFVRHGTSHRRIELCSGDLVSPSALASDVLVVSAVRGSYVPTARSLVGALARTGVSVEELAQNKAVDLLQTCSCWLSEELGPRHPGFPYRRILCFEPAGAGSPAEVVGDIFRALLPFLGDAGFKSVAMPVVSTGEVGAPVSDMLTAIVEAARNWMSLGVSLDELRIFAPLSESAGEEARRVFAELKRAAEATVGPTGEAWEYDVFLSYAHEDVEQAIRVADQLRGAEPGLRLFLDRQSLDPGSAWQHKLFDALDSSRRVLALYSPAYVSSKVCKEEFNIAWARSRDTDRAVLLPLYLFTAQLPTYMKLVQYIDCREGSAELLASACHRILAG
jgi:hypothetical protein